LKDNLIEARSVGQIDTFDAAVKFAKAEGIIPAPETAHAIAQVVKEVNQLKAEGREATILFNFSGHGFFDLSAYDQYFSGELDNYSVGDNEISENLVGVEALQL